MHKNCHVYFTPAGSYIPNTINIKINSEKLFYFFSYVRYLPCYVFKANKSYNYIRYKTRHVLQKQKKAKLIILYYVRAQRMRKKIMKIIRNVIIFQNYFQ